MFRSDYSGYESSSASDHLSFTPDDQHLSPTEGSSAKRGSVSTKLENNGRNVSALFSPELSPNKRAIMEAMLSHWVVNRPSEHQSSKSVLSAQDQSVSASYSSPVQPPASSSLHPLERKAS